MTDCPNPKIKCRVASGNCIEYCQDFIKMDMGKQIVYCKYIPPVDLDTLVELIDNSYCEFKAAWTQGDRPEARRLARAVCDGFNKFITEIEE